MEPTVIRSADNKKLKLVRKLIDSSKERKSAGLFVAEGSRCVDELLTTAEPEAIFVSESFFSRQDKHSLMHTIVEDDLLSVHVVDDKVFSRISSYSASEGMMGVFKRVSFSLDMLFKKKKCFCVLCENIQDPSNVGAIIRSSVCFGADAVLLTAQSVDIYNPKVVSSSAGYLARIPVIAITSAELKKFRQTGFVAYASVLDNSVSFSIQNIKEVPDKAVIAFGNEGNGLSDLFITQADKKFFIPISEQTDSLNVAQTVAVALFYLNVQIRKK